MASFLYFHYTCFAYIVHACSPKRKYLYIFSIIINARQPPMCRRPSLSMHSFSWKLHTDAGLIRELYCGIVGNGSASALGQSVSC